jgi:flavin reductase (DIM6/NTAB) family NADH-FMN oxidoreductase RutF
MVGQAVSPAVFGHKGRMLKQARKTLKRVVLGNADVPEQCTVAMSDPQSEVAVWLHGLGSPIDVTERHAIVCAAPPIVAIRLDDAAPAQTNPGATLLLKFHDRGGDGVVLGQLELQSSAVVETGAGDLCLFEVRSSQNYCLPRLRIWSHSLFQAWLRARSKAVTDVAMTARAAGAMTVLFICPRPVVLVSLTLGDSGNIFPMNLMGSFGNGYFAFGLNSRRLASSLVERAGRIAVSGIPFEAAPLARQLGKNHRLEAVDWSELPFRVTLSPALRIPVPSFASRVREMEIEAVRKLGSHTLFVARILSDERRSDSPQFFMIHGLYQAWRRSNGRIPLDAPMV